MPIYEFRCDNCRNGHEERREYVERDLPAECPSCHSRASRIPSLTAMIVERPRSQAESNDSLQNKNHSPAAMNFSNVKNCSITNVAFANIDKAIYLDNTEDFKGENLTFNNVRIGIEHKNSNLTLKKLKSEKF